MPQHHRGKPGPHRKERQRIGRVDTVKLAGKESRQSETHHNANRPSGQRRTPYEPLAAMITPHAASESVTAVLAAART